MICSGVIPFSNSMCYLIAQNGDPKKEEMSLLMPLAVPHWNNLCQIGAESLIFTVTSKTVNYEKIQISMKIRVISSTLQHPAIPRAIFPAYPH